MAEAREETDVAIIGAGIVGLAIAYHLSKLSMRVMVIEKEAEAGMGVTAGQANVVHVVQLPFGSLKSKLARKGNAMYDGLCRELEVRLNRLPALLVVRGWLRFPLLCFVYLYLKLELRGQFKVQLMRGGSLRQIEPLLVDEVSGGIVVHGYGAIDAQELVTRMKEAAERNGVIFAFGRELKSAEQAKGTTLLKTMGKEVNAKFVVNAAGLYSDEVSRILSKDLGKVEPGLGVMAVYSGLELKSIVAPLPLSIGSRTKGGAIIPATDGTTIVGPTLRVASSKKDQTYRDEDLEILRAKFLPLLRAKGNFVKAYTGVRPLSPTRDFIIEFDSTARVVNLVGIESPGLTAAPAIAELVGRMITGEGA